MIRTIVVDDEAPARSRMLRILRGFPEVTVIAEASDGVKALETIAMLKPDLVFLDIEMPELDGLGVARAIEPEGPAIVFVTAYDQHALKAFEVCAVDYLVKPLTSTRVAAALEKIRRRTSKNPKDLTTLLQKLDLEKNSPRFAVKCGAKYVVFDPKKVSAIIAKDHYAAILVDGKELLADDSLEVLASRLSSNRFIQIHRSAMINVDFLQELEHEGDRKYTAVLSDVSKTRLPVSRERLSELRVRLGLN